MSRQYRKASEEDEFFLREEEPLGFTVRTKQSNLFTVHINKEIKEPSYYSRIFDLMLEAGEEDVIQLLIASPGGRLDGLNILLEGIRTTSAHVIGIILGEAHSAAAILALNCHEVATTASGEMLIHCVRYGTFGKASDISAHVIHTNKIAEKLFRDTFEGYLSEQEIVQVLDGREMFLDSEQIMERLEMQENYFCEKQQELEAELEEEEIPVEKPKSRSTRGKKQNG